MPKSLLSEDSMCLEVESEISKQPSQNILRFVERIRVLRSRTKKIWKKKNDIHNAGVFKWAGMAQARREAQTTRSLLRSKVDP